MSDFESVIVSKLEELKSERNRVTSTAMNANFHVEQVRSALQSVIPQIQEHPGDEEELKREFVSVLGQVPDLVRSVWIDVVNQLNTIDSESRKWQEMLSLYSGWKEENIKPAKKELSDEDKEAIETGEIQEPSKMGSIRRKPGTRPPITLGQYRRHESDSGEDSEA